ncbi:hypothetical protein NPIL_613111 [Nephila pilipes]|uniref:Uncharacterized protein n=1 Tax=Nephila pilipes TaxID=299642 RepID=A0A8X6R2Z7_NEPPI|nr:hypothetical protein NPIL_613111 [Nephila pilipes]
MVMKNAATGRSKTDLPALYDELEAKIRALESLGRKQEKFGDFLSPLVLTGRSISGLGKKQKPWINREQRVTKFKTFDEFSSSGSKG